VLVCTTNAWSRDVLSSPASLWATKSLSCWCDILHVMKGSCLRWFKQCIWHPHSQFEDGKPFPSPLHVTYFENIPPRPYVTNHSDLDLEDDLDGRKVVPSSQRTKSI
jgi:hypothetical protein